MAYEDPYAHLPRRALFAPAGLPTVTQIASHVTKSKAIENITISSENVTRGGKRAGAGRKLRHASAAEKQRAYRERKHRASK